MHKDLRELSPEVQAQEARKCFAEVPAHESVEFLASVPLYGLCIGLLEGGQRVVGVGELSDPEGRTGRERIPDWHGCGWARR